mgnify:CR=1 FL=1
MCKPPVLRVVLTSPQKTLCAIHTLTIQAQSSGGSSSGSSGSSGGGSSSDRDNSGSTGKVETTTKPDGTKVQTETKVEIPVTNVKPGTVAVLVHPDGTEEIIKNSVPTEDGIQLTVNGGATVKIVDNSKDFIDTRNHWAKDEINFVASRELFKGVTEEHFGVERTMTRAMVNTVLARLAGVDTTPAIGQNWYDKGIAWARENGVSDGTNPNGNVTREQLAAMLYRYAGSPAVSGSLPFSDAGSVSDYAQNALIWATQNGILNGYADGRVVPAANSQRSQVAAMMARFIQNAQ